MGNYFQKDIECADREVIRDIQSRRLVEQVKHVWDNVAPYRKEMEEAGLTPDDIKSVDDLHKLPFTEKSFLRDNYPDGLLAVPQRDCVRIHSTSGTTGNSKAVMLSHKNMERLLCKSYCCSGRYS